MKYIGLLIILIFFVSTLIAFIKDVKYGRQNTGATDKRKKSLLRGIIGIVIEILILCYFSILLVYYGFN